MKTFKIEASTEILGNRESGLIPNVVLLVHESPEFVASIIVWGRDSVELNEL